MTGPGLSYPGYRHGEAGVGGRAPPAFPHATGLASGIRLEPDRRLIIRTIPHSRSCPEPTQPTPIASTCGRTSAIQTLSPRRTAPVS